MINWRVRFRHKGFMVAFVTTLIAFGYQLLALFDVAPPIGQDEVLQVLGLVATMLTAGGVLIDPTTAGISDSARALRYEKPRHD